MIEEDFLTKNYKKSKKSVIFFIIFMYFSIRDRLLSLLNFCDFFFTIKALIPALVYQ